MLRMSLAASGVAICLAVPAFAQGLAPDSTTNSMPSDDTSAMTCDQIMQKVRAHSLYSSGAIMAMKQKEMAAASAAKNQNDEAGCKMHATKALKLMMQGG